MAQCPAVPQGQSVAEGSSRLTRVRRHYDTARTSCRTATLLRPQYKQANDPRQAVCPANEHPTTQSDSNNASVGAPGYHTPTERTAPFTLCYVMQPSFQEATHAYVSVVGVHHSMMGIPHYHPSAKLLANCRFRLSESVDESPPASSTTQLIIPLSTQPV